MAIDKEKIIAESLILLKEEGLEGITFRKLISRLKIKAPAIYWRFDNKRELLEEVAEAILLEQFSDFSPYRASETTWQDWLLTTFNRLRRALLAYPDGARVVAGARPYHTPTLSRIAEYSLRALEDGGLGLRTAGEIVFTALHFTFGHVIEEQSSPSIQELSQSSAATLIATYPTIESLITLSQAEDYTQDAIYELSLNLIIKGGEVKEWARLRAEGLSKKEIRKRLRFIPEILTTSES
jgi:TetR/AcrR family tetracycline transcriptional repressor